MALSPIEKVGIGFFGFLIALVVIFTATHPGSNKPGQRPAQTQKQESPKPGAPDEIRALAAASANPAPNERSLYLLPDHVGRLQLVEVLVDGEGSSHPSWPAYARYIYIRNAAHPEAHDAELNCSPSEAGALKCEKKEKADEVGGQAICLGKPDPHAYARWMADGWDCMLSARTGLLDEPMILKASVTDAVSFMHRVRAGQLSGPEAVEHHRLIAQAHAAAQRHR
jgi:hypothetical protein